VAPDPSPTNPALAYAASLQAVNGQRFLVHVMLSADFQDGKQVQCRHNPSTDVACKPKTFIERFLPQVAMVFVFGNPMPLGPVFQEV